MTTASAALSASSPAPSKDPEQLTLRRQMPSRLIFIRHGESEANVLNREIKAGKRTEYPPGFANIPDREIRLSVQGRKQAILTGEWMKHNFPVPPKIIYVSDHVRAGETAALACKAAGWLDVEIRIDPLLGERSWGKFAHKDEATREEILAGRKRDPLHNPMPDGEALLATRHRSRQLLDRCARQFGGEEVLVFSHGEFIEAIWAEIAHMYTEQQIDFFHSAAGDIKNCQVVEFSSVDPVSGASPGKLMWVKSQCPQAGIVGAWSEIERKKLTPDELLARVERYPTLVEALSSVAA